MTTRRGTALMAVLAVFAVCGLSSMGTADAADIPPVLDGTGVDTLSWVIDRFGLPGVFAILAWRLSGAMKMFRGIPLELTVRIVDSKDKDKE